jgi:hypothetical protein
MWFIIALAYWHPINVLNLTVLVAPSYNGMIRSFTIRRKMLFHYDIDRGAMRLLPMNRCKHPNKH